MTLAILSGVIAALGLLWSVVWAVHTSAKSTRAAQVAANAELIADLQRQLTEVRLEMARSQNPIMKQVQDLLSANQHHPHPDYARQDFLLEQLDDSKLTNEQTTELVGILHTSITAEGTPDGEKETARALIAIMPLVVKETEAAAASATPEAKSLLEQQAKTASELKMSQAKDAAALKNSQATEAAALSDATKVNA